MQATLGYTIFYVSDVEATVSFYEAGFGLAKRFVTPEGDYGELETGATTLSFVRHDLAASNLDAVGGFTRLDTETPPVGASITLVTDDVPAMVAQATGAGATSYTEPTVKPWGQTVAYLRDPNGILIEVATPVAS